MAEQWRDIPGWEGLYQVSDQGNVRALKATSKYKAGRILSKRPNKQGYCRTALSRNNRAKDHFTHCLVMMAFVSMPPFPDAEVNHINGIKNDNRLENLEWCTPKQNMEHARNVLHIPKPKGERNGRAVLTDDAVRQIRMLAASGMKYADLSTKFGVSMSRIGGVVRGETWKHIK